MKSDFWGRSKSELNYLVISPSASSSTALLVWILFERYEQHLSGVGGISGLYFLGHRARSIVYSWRVPSRPQIYSTNHHYHDMGMKYLNYKYFFFFRSLRIKIQTWCLLCKRQPKPDLLKDLPHERGLPQSPCNFWFITMVHNWINKHLYPQIKPQVYLGPIKKYK